MKDIVREERQDTWQSAFVAMLPEIKRRLRAGFHNLNADAREEAVEEGVVHCLLSYARLCEQGKANVPTAATLSWYAVLQVKRGRSLSCRMNSKEPLSRYAQLGRGFRAEPINGKWIDTLVEDKRAPVPDQVAAKLDVGAWFATLASRTKQIAKDLAHGFSTSEVAAKHGVTAGRISQLRRSLEESWGEFQGEAEPASAW